MLTLCVADCGQASLELSDQVLAELWSRTEPGIPLLSMAGGIINTDRSHSPDINLGRQISSGRNDANCCLFAYSR